LVGRPERKAASKGTYVALQIPLGREQLGGFTEAVQKRLGGFTKKTATMLSRKT